MTGAPPGPGAGGQRTSKASKVNGGETVHPASDQPAVVLARCQAPAGTTAWGRSPAPRSLPNRMVRTSSPAPPSSMASSTGEPA